MRQNKDNSINSLHFTSLIFAVFVITLFFIYYSARGTAIKLLILTIASYIFYGAWDVRFTVLLFGYTMIGWTTGYLIETTSNPRRRKLFVSIGVALSLLTLIFFKYTEFIYSIILSVLDITPSKSLGIVLPIAISFTTFEVISYMVDVYRREIRHERSLLRFALFMSFFPRLVAGPIIRPSDFLPQITSPLGFDFKGLRKGAQIFLFGFLIKVVAADTLSILVDDVFADPQLYSTATLWLGAIAYSGQIFCDFHGYSQMAIGLALMFGIRLPENFRMPYLSRSLTEFWRRWHISLSSWLRDYLYIPLGGGRCSQGRTIANLMITMSLGGLWHGASWNFLIWGVLHGVILSAEKLFKLRARQKHQLSTTKAIFEIPKIFITFLTVTLLWIPFRSPEFSNTFNYIVRLFTPSDGIHWFHTQSLQVLFIILIWHALHLLAPRFLDTVRPHENSHFKNYIWATSVIVIIMIFSPQRQSSFIYFQF